MGALSMISEEEIWKDILGFEGLYQVSNLGRVKSLSKTRVDKNGVGYNQKEKIMKPRPSNSGYLGVVLYKRGEKKSVMIHQIVAIAFLNHTPCGFEIVVDHINSIKTDNRATNLQLITNRENSSKDKKGGSSKYVGVSWNKEREKWGAAIKIKTKSLSLGYFVDEIKAAEMYQKALDNIEKLEKCKTRKEINKILEIVERKFTSKYKGVSFCKTSQKWKAQTTINKKKVSIGYFNTEEEASEAYQKKVANYVLQKGWGH